MPISSDAFEVTDADGTVRARLGLGPDGALALDLADADGRIRATFDIVWLSGWAPDASQPKPLKPGSATARLADAVNAARRD